MFIDELKPMVQEVTQQPIAFFGGFVSGLLRLNLSEDPVKTWLNQQGIRVDSTNSQTHGGNNSGKGPQSINID